MPDNSITIMGARLIFRNFQGKEGPFNKEGRRNFGVILPEEDAEQMAALGWPVKRLNPSEEEQEQGLTQGPPWLPVKVRYDTGRPPKITLVSSEGRRPVTEDSVDLLDSVDIAVDDDGTPKVDLTVRPYNYDIPGGRQGISIYLKNMYLTIEEDELDRKYAQQAHNE